MAPKRRCTKAPKIIDGASRVNLRKISRKADKSGWRATRRGRVNDLRVKFLGGGFSATALGQVQLLAKTDEDDLYLIDDGRATVETLVELLDAFEENPEVDPDGNPWHDNLVEVFEKGLPVTWVRYDNDDMKTRKLWNIYKHDEDNNKFDVSTVACKVRAASDALQAAGSDRTRAMNDMLEILGDGAASRLKRWLRAAQGIDGETLTELEACPWITNDLIFDNVYFVGGGVGHDKKLAAFFAKAALVLAAQDYADNGEKLAIKKEEWAGICSRLKVVELWKRLLVHKFGDIASNSQALARLVDSLCTKSGLEKVKTCMEQSIPLQGKSDNIVGIPECRALWQELTKCQQGGLPPPTVQPTLESTPEKLSGGRRVDAEQDQSEAMVEAMACDESLRCSLQEAVGAEQGDDDNLPAGVNRQNYELWLQAKQYFEAVSFLEVDRDFDSACRQITGPSLYIIDLPTSRKGAISLAIEKFAEIFADTHHVRLVTNLLNRTDYIHDVGVKLKAQLPTWYHVPLTHLSSSSFKAAYAKSGRTAFFWLSVPMCDKLTSFPNSLESKSQLQPGEKLKVLCTDANCPFYGGKNPKATGDKFDDIDPDNKDVAIDKIMEITNDMEGEQSAENDAAEEIVAQMERLQGGETENRNADKYLFVHANSIDYYSQYCSELGGASGHKILILHTSSMHPSPWLAARSQGMSVIVHGFRTNEHQRRHGIALAVSVRLTQLLKEKASTEAEAPKPQPMSLIEVHHNAAQDGALEAFDVSKGDHWADGINREFEPATLLKLMNPLLNQELDSTNLALEAPRQGIGRGLRNNMWMGEGETICDATCLWFDSQGLLQKFLDKHPDERDRAGVVQGVVRNGIKVDMYFVLIGCAQFINHFAGHRKTPNAMLQFNPLLGFNRGSLKVVVNTRNKQGLSSGEIFSNYGLRYDLTLAYPKTNQFQERLKGPLTKFMKVAEVQASGVSSADGADNGGADPPGPTKNERAGASLGGEGPQPANGDAGAGVSLGGEGPQPASGDAGADEGVNGGESSAKRLKTTDNACTFKKPFHFVLQWGGGKVSLQSMETENKRLKRHFEFIFLADGEFKECQNFTSLGANEIAFDLDEETLVSESAQDAEWMPLSKFCKPKGKKSDKKDVNVFGIETTPKIRLAPQLWKFVSVDHELLGFLKEAMRVPGLFLGWRLKADHSDLYKPTGCGIFLDKMITLKAAETLTLE